MRFLAFFAAIIFAGSSGCRTAPKAAPSTSDLRIPISEGRARHYLLRSGRTAVHLNLMSGDRYRVLAAFPAGNSGVAAWFTSEQKLAKVDFEGEPEAIAPGTVRFRAEFGVQALALDSAVLGSIRHIRDWDIDRKRPDAIKEQMEQKGTEEIALKRASLNGRYNYGLNIRVLNGRITRTTAGAVQFVSKGEEPLRFEFTAFSTEPPLTPLAPADILKPESLSSTPARDAQMLAFLMYKEKFLAGSWTYLTYFGRDTLLTLRLLMPALQPQAVEAMLGAVIHRLVPDGDVAHEEEIGDFAAYHHLQNKEAVTDAPIYDYKMIDDDFLLPIVLAKYIRETPADRVRAFLSRQTGDGRGYRDAILSNIGLVEQRTQAFARQPSWRNLISLKPGRHDGEWRDSPTGLGGGRYPFDVNAALAPAALNAAIEILTSPAAGMADEARRGRLKQASEVWGRKARPFFEVTVPAAQASKMAQEYTRELKLTPPGKTAQPVAFTGVSLDAKGKPVPVMHSDEAMAMIFTNPSDMELLRIANLVLADFPYGLRSPVGLLVANPAFAPAYLRAQFTAAHYHGTVVWSWQQALMAAALAAQLERTDLRQDTRAKLKIAQDVLWKMIEATKAYRASELWSWTREKDQMFYVPYGQGSGHHTESNPNQGWSHAFIGVRRPD